MKRILTISCAFLLALGASAQVDAQSKRLENGFYRVQNHGTKRYAYIYDNVGSINYGITDADMGAVFLARQDAHDRFSDPASVCYVQKVSNKHNVFGQNTSFFDIISHYVQIQDAKDTNGTDCYKITPIKSGTYVYLRDGQTTGSQPESFVCGKNNEQETPKNFEAFRWDFIQFTPNGDEYLGVAPNEAMKVDDKYYKPYVIGFDMTLLSPGMKAYYVSEVKPDAVVLKEITGTIPYNTPVIIECSSTNPSANRVNVSITKSARISDNRLAGNYFCYGDHGESAYTVYNPQTMRVLMVKNGKLVFGTADATDNIHTTIVKVANGDDPDEELQCLSANSSYLKVPADFPAEIAVMTEEEYNATHGGAVSGDADGNGSVNVADVNGNGGIVEMVLKKTAENFPTADFNKDGKVTIVDIALLIKQLLTNK